MIGSVRRVLLLLPTGTYRAGDFVLAAARLGVEVVVASEHRQAMAASMEGRALVVPLHRPEAAAEAIVAFAADHPVDAVVAVDEQGVQPAAMAAERLGLVHNPPPAVAATRNKVASRRALEAAGVPQPRFRVAGTGDDLGRLAEEVGLPCVVKPVSLSASRGVIRADDPQAAVAAGRRVRAILDQAGEDPDGPLLVEHFLPGAEVAVEGLLHGGELDVLAVFDKPDPLDGPYFEETIYVTPSRLAAAVLHEVHALVAAAVAALGLTEGPVHAEVRVGPDGCRVVEVAARSIGGLCSRALRFGAGVSLEELILRHALGLGLEGMQRELRASGVMMIPIPRSGVLVEVRGIEAARAVEGIEGVEITVTRGRPVQALPEGDRYLGFLFARAPTPGQVEAALRQAHACLEVVVDTPR
ncbi:MAG: ATP-grasp domain-containing protein [Actinobacteria bacterium]|nr:ATP-grasp domain-containing protein [Actinomycetota bacterium]